MQLNDLKRDPSRPLSDIRIASHREGPVTADALLPEDENQKPWWKFFYDREQRTFCERSCKSWFYIISYSILYIIFLSTYTLILLYISLYIVKSKETYINPDSLVLWGGHEIGLTATPTAMDKMSLIWYKDGDLSDYGKYVSALENLVGQRDSGISDHLGPCGKTPFGYGDSPCVIVRINRHYGSVGLPLKPQDVNSSDIPDKVKVWVKMDSKLWLHCRGNNAYDEDHIGTIKYYPDPPGFTSGSHAPGNDSSVDLVAVQFSNFTKGLALAVECSLYYEGDKSTVDFVLYVSGSRKKYNPS